MKTKNINLIIVLFSLVPFFSYSQKDTLTINELSQKEIKLVTYDNPPQFPDGSSELLIFIKKNIIYPQYAFKNNIQGRVYVMFIVTKNGTIKNIEIVKSTNELFNKEAIRLIELMPNWIPGQKNGENVDAAFVMPITFNNK